MGMLTLPYMFIFEFLAPIIELTGFIVFLYLAFTGAVNWNTAWMIYLTIYTFCQFLSLSLTTITSECFIKEDMSIYGLSSPPYWNLFSIIRSSLSAH